MLTNEKDMTIGQGCIRKEIPHSRLSRSLWPKDHHREEEEGGSIPGAKEIGVSVSGDYGSK